MISRRITALAAAAVLLTGCAAESQADRPAESGGKNPDRTLAATHVDVYLNADKVPNVAMFCLGPWRFVATLNGSGEVATRGGLDRFPEGDSVCGPQ